MNNYEEDDHYTDCVEYAEGLIHKTFVEEEFVIQIENMLNCAQPWLITAD